MLKIAGRAMKRLKNGASPQAVANYLAQALAGPHFIVRLREHLRRNGGTLPMLRALDLAEALQKSRIRRLRERRMGVERLIHDKMRPELERKDALVREAARRGEDGTLVRWLSGLGQEDRKLAGTGEERRRAVALRSRCLANSAVMARLGCSKTELDRWDREGLLPHLYRRRCPLYFSTGSVDKRYWLEDDVAKAAALVDSWRLEWEARKRARRTRLRPAARSRRSDSGVPGLKAEP